MPETETERVVLSEAVVLAEWWIGEGGDYADVALDRLTSAVERILADRHAALLAELAASREALARVSDLARRVCLEEDAEFKRCHEPADFILWGKLFEPEALGPRCHDHAVQHTGHNMPRQADQWAVVDLRDLRAALATPTERTHA